MKKIWKIIGLTVVIFCVAGVLCIGASLFLGGSLNGLYENEISAAVLDKLSPVNLISGLLALFVA